jgi:ketosteroid isomerase-like protein
VDHRDAFVARFTAGWAGGRATLGSEFDGHVAEDVLLTQPLLPPARGVEGFRAQLERMFRAVPDLRGHVHAWGPTEDGVLIDMTFHGTLAGRPFELPNCDRIVLRDGLLAERHARFDPLPVLAIAARRPWALAPLVRAIRR